MNSLLSLKMKIGCYYKKDVPRVGETPYNAIIFCFMDSHPFSLIPSTSQKRIANKIKIPNPINKYLSSFVSFSCTK